MTLDRRLVSFLRGAFFALVVLFASPLVWAEVRLPNGEYTESSEDLKVKVLGGYVTVARSWTNGRWYVNPTWADLKLTLDSLDGSVKAVDRAGSMYERSGNGIFIFENRFFITSTPSGFRWYDQLGNWITYDSSGHITAYGDRNNVQVTFQLDANGQRTQILDHFNNPVLTFQYAGGQLAGVTDRTGRKVQYLYTGNNLTQVMDVLGNPWNYTYDGNGQITSRTDPEGHTTTIVYAQSTTAGAGAVGMKGYLANNLSVSAGVGAKAAATVGGVSSTGATPKDYKIARVFTVTDPEGFTTTYLYTYDRTTLRYTVTQKFPGGRQVTGVYDRDGWLLQQTIGTRVVYTLVRDGDRTELTTDERGLTTRTEFDSARNPLKITYPDGTNVLATYDSVYSNRLTRTDEAGALTTYDYDSKGNLLKMTEAVGLPEQRVTTRTYDQYGQCLTTTRKGATVAEDATTTYAYDAFGNVANLSNPVNKSSQYTYDVMANPVLITDLRGNKWNKTYNAKGWTLTQTDPMGHSTGFAYDRAGNRIKIADALSNATTFSYNKNNWAISMTDPLIGVTRYEYDQEGRRTKQIDPSGITRTMVYDGDGRLIKKVDGNANATQTVYGDDSDGLNGLVAGVIYPSYSERYKYDQRNRLTQTIQVLDQATQYTTGYGYDGRGNWVSQVDALGRATLNDYDALNRRIRMTDALGGLTMYGYDARDNLRSVIDANGHITAYDYDLSNRLVQETRPLGEMTKYAYDGNGNLVVRTSPNGEQQQYSYDLANQRTQELLFGVTNGSLDSSPSKIVNYTRDPRNLLVGYDDGITSGAYVFDAKRQKTEETVNYGAFSKTIQYSYQANGSKKTFTYPDNTLVRYGYDGNNQLQTIAMLQGTISYDNYQWTVPTQITMPGATKTMAYDPLLRRTQIRVQANGSGSQGNPQGAVLMDLRYRYDGIGNILQRTTQDGDYLYQYDNLDRLTDAVPPPGEQATTINPNGLPLERYAYDGVHNRLASAHQPGPWIYNTDNQLLQYGQGAEQVRFQYDANGHTVNQVKSGQSVIYGYDASERLISIKEAGGATLANYYYDPMGRRLSKTVGGTTTYFQYADEGLIGELDGAGALTVLYGWQPNGAWGSNPQFKREGNQFAFYHNDDLGTSQRITDSFGAVVWSARSEAFGKFLIESELVANNLRFSGQYFDSETSTNYNYYRNYDPSIGRYQQTDPIGLDGGLNAYVYASGNPLAFDDPNGLAGPPRGRPPRAPPPPPAHTPEHGGRSIWDNISDFLTGGNRNPFHNVVCLEAKCVFKDDCGKERVVIVRDWMPPSPYVDELPKNCTCILMAEPAWKVGDPTEAPNPFRPE